MANRAVKVGGGWWRAVEVRGGVVALASGVLLVSYLHHPPPASTILHHPDIHAEYVKYVSGRDTITGYLAYPERKDPAPGVVVIHEIFGMSDFIRQTTEQLAKDGFVALAPDLLSRRGGTPPATDDARKLIAGLNPDTVTLDLDATVAYLRTLKAVRRDRIGVNGPGPEAAAIARIRARGLGVYAENDARIDAGLADVAAAVKQYAKDYRYTVYPGVGHGFLRSRDKPEVADSAWGAVIRFFRESLER